MSQTTNVVITQSIRKEELPSIEDDGMELNSLDQSRNIATTASRNTCSAEAQYVNSAHPNPYPSKGQGQSNGGNPKTWWPSELCRSRDEETPFCLEHIAPRYSCGITMQMNPPTTKVSGKQQEKLSKQETEQTSTEADNDEQEELTA